MIGNLRCEYLREPLAVSNRNPRLSWVIKDDRRGAVQTGFFIMASSEKAELLKGNYDLWESGRVKTKENFVIYAGNKLGSRAECWWKVICDVSDNAGNAVRYESKPAFFKIGLEKSEFEGKWIEDSAPQAPFSSAHAGYLSENTKNPAEEKWVTVDLKDEYAVDNIIIYGARPFYMPERIPDSPGYLFPIKFRLSTACNADFSDEKVIFNAETPYPNPGCQPVFFTALGEFRYIRFTAAELQERLPGEYAFALSQIMVLKDNENLALKGEAVAKDSFEDEFWGVKKLIDGDVTWHTAGNAKSLVQPMMRRDFIVKDGIKRAYAYATALGVYELTVNGKKTGSNMLAPEWTDYNKYAQYQCYDVKDLLLNGENALGVRLGDGWYAGRVGMANVFGPKVLRGIYGSAKPKFLMQLELEYSDGTREIVSTDEDFMSTLFSPIRSSDIYDGEVFDARFEEENWNLPGFLYSEEWRSSIASEGVDIDIIPQINEPIVKIESRKGRTVNKTSEGDYIVDFGQGWAGIARMKLKGEKGQRITIRYCQELKKDGSGYFANLRGAIPIDVYICKGGKSEVYEPRFTYRGFRYIQIKGLKYKPKASDFESILLSSGTDRTGYYEFDNELYNRVSEATYYTLRSNLLGIQTDCCERDERLGWNMDGFEDSRYYLDTGRLFLRNTLEREKTQSPENMRPEQTPDALHMFTGILQLDVKHPKLMYQHYDDLSLAKHLYEYNKNIIINTLRQFPDHIVNTLGYVDWLNGDKVEIDGYPTSGAQVGTPIFQTSLLLEQLDTMAYFAGLLGKGADGQFFKNHAKILKKAVKDKFVNKDGTVERDTQTGYAHPLYFDMFEGKDKINAVQKLSEAVKRYGNRFSAGPYTLSKMLSVLSCNGLHELACKMFANDKAPSFKYMMNNGATTLWERWDSRIAQKPDIAVKKRWQAEADHITYISENGFGDIGMNSFNHLEFSCISKWLAEEAAGFAIKDKPVTEEFTVKVRPCKDIWSAKSVYDSFVGRIEVDWKRKGDELVLNLLVPVSSSAKIFMPCDTIYERGQNIKNGNFEILGSGGEGIWFKAPAGRFKFTGTLK